MTWTAISYSDIRWEYPDLASLSSYEERYSYMMGRMKKAEHMERESAWFVSCFDENRDEWRTIHDRFIELAEFVGGGWKIPNYKWRFLNLRTGREIPGLPFDTWTSKRTMQEYRDENAEEERIRHAQVDRMRSQQAGFADFPGISKWIDLTVGDIVIDIEIPDRSPTGLATGLDRILLITRDMQRMLTYLPKTALGPDCSGSVVPGDTGYRFRTRFHIGGTLIDEREFFRDCARFEAFDERMVQFIHQVNEDVCRVDRGKVRSTRERMQDDFINPGAYAIYALSLRDRRHLPLLAALLEDWILEREHRHVAVIDHLLSHNGPCDECLELLAARLGGSGQLLAESLDPAFHAHGYKAWLREAGRLDRMLERFLRRPRQRVLDGYNPERSFYAIDLVIEIAAASWSNGDPCDYAEFIQHALHVLGPDVDHLTNWHRSPAVEDCRVHIRGDLAFPPWQPIPDDHECYSGLKTTYDPSRLVPSF
jgi:hypothetical protein